MSLIARVESELEEAYLEARQAGVWQTLTFVTPSRLASLQWRRRLARKVGTVFNVRFVDLNDFVMERLSGQGTAVRRVPKAVELAAAWRAVDEGPARFRSLARHSVVPAQVARAFDVFQGLEDEEQARVTPEFAELAERLA